jgi:hypothetical protein
VVRRFAAPSKPVVRTSAPAVAPPLLGEGQAFRSVAIDLDVLQRLAEPAMSSARALESAKEQGKDLEVRPLGDLFAEAEAKLSSRT